ncbi:Putative NADH dehydrogenase [Verticillium dahliae VDG2]|nr:Putative NADH dehydrogenase [Verticillium dahliae VDG2]
MSIDKHDAVDGDTPESRGSSLEADHHASANNANNAAGNASQENQQPKRKGGRKPIYATSEERKQRNRQAQAAFRERRTEYIKQLEEAIRVHESNLHNLQAAHRTAADECLMLRYKNSLLERILLEKGIDVQAELRAKTGSPNLGPTHVPQNMVQPPPIQRAIMGRHQARRSNSSIAPKLERGIGALPPLHAHTSTASPKSRPTPSSHANSPTGTASVFGGPSAVSPAASDHAPRMAGAMKSHISPLAPMNPATRAHMMSSGPARVGTGAQYYPTPAFQNHIEQLEQEYDAPADMVDDSEMDTPSGPGPYPAQYQDGQPSMVTSPNGGHNGHHVTQGEAVQSSQAPHGAYPSMTQLLDNGGDWDPFGLSASMAFPTQFSFDTSNMRANGDNGSLNFHGEITSYFTREKLRKRLSRHR